MRTTANHALSPVGAGLPLKRSHPERAGRLTGRVGPLHRRIFATLHLHRGVLLIGVIFILLTTAGNLLVPPFEGPDEPMHYAYVQHLAQGYGFPSQEVPDVFSDSYRPLQEALQPPLYYSLAALATACIPGAGNVEGALVRNPYFSLKDPDRWLDNENLWLRSPSVGALDPGFVLGVRSARLVSTCFGLVVLIGIYGLGLTCFDGDRKKACLGAAWVAFNPQLVHISGMVNNDSAVAGLSALCLWAMAGWVIRGPSLGKALAWGVTLGLAMLAKVSVLGILPVCALGFWLGVRSERPRRAVGYAAIVLGLGLLLSGWWYVRGFVLYGDPLGLVPHLDRSDWVGEPFSMVEQLSRVGRVDWSYWAAFGSAAVQPPEWLLGTVVWWARIGLLGVVPHAWRSWSELGQKRSLIALLLIGVFIYLAALLWWLWAFPLALGRLMFPVAGAIGVLLVMGWQGWLRRTTPFRWRIVRPTDNAIPKRHSDGARIVRPTDNAIPKRRSDGARIVRARTSRASNARPFVRPSKHAERPPRWRSAGLWAMTAGLLVFVVVSLWAVIRPAYVRPPQLSASRLAALDKWQHVVFGDGAKLLAGQVNRRPVYPGEWTWVELCWESVAPLEKDYLVFVHFLGPDDRIVARRHTHAGLGTFPTSAWQPGDAFCDRVHVRVEDDAPAPAVYDIEVGLYDGEREERLEALGEDEQIVAPVLAGRVKVWATEPPAATPWTPGQGLPHPTDYLLGDEIALVGYRVHPTTVRAGQGLTLTLHWRAEDRPAADYSAFVHLVDRAGNLVAQADGPPQGGLYPTSWWETGDGIEDVRNIAVPVDAGVGKHSIVVGLYRWETMERLPIYAADGTAVPDRAIRLVEVDVVR